MIYKEEDVAQGMKTIILDTNFVLWCLDHKIDMEQELERVCSFPYRIAVLKKTTQELQEIKHPKAKIALQLIQRYVQLDTPGAGYTDDDICLLEQKTHILATQDQELKRRWKGQKITVRDKSHLILQ